jgi:hypothetical protein
MSPLSRTNPLLPSVERLRTRAPHHARDAVYVLGLWLSASVCVESAFDKRALLVSTPPLFTTGYRTLFTVLSATAHACAYVSPYSGITDITDFCR